MNLLLDAGEEEGYIRVSFPLKVGIGDRLGEFLEPLGHPHLCVAREAGSQLFHLCTRGFEECIKSHLDGEAQVLVLPYEAEGIDPPEHGIQKAKVQFGLYCLQYDATP